jgi:hypothetical protein
MEKELSQLKRRRSSVAHVATLLRVGGSGIRVQIGIIYFCFQKVHTGSGARPTSYSMGNGILPKAKIPSCKVTTYFFSSATVRN